MNRVIFLSLFLLTMVSNPAAAEKFSVNGVMLDYDIRGDGPPLYLLHGGMESRDSFKSQIPTLSRHFTVVALDSREQGRSGRSDEQITYELMSKDVIALANHLGHEKISIMGSSDGGITAIIIAIQRPELIDKLVLLGATFHYDSYPAGVREFIAGYEWDGNTDPKRYPGNFIEHYLTGHSDLSGFGDLLKEMSVMWTGSPNFKKTDLNVIRAKTMIINGDRQDTVLSHVLDLYEAIPDARLFIVPNATHYVMQEKPTLINNIIIKFLTGG